MAGQSTSAQFLKPAVLSPTFGVLFTLSVSLLLVPAMYLIDYDWQQMRLARENGKSDDADTTEAVPASI